MSKSYDTDIYNKNCQSALIRSTEQTILQRGNNVAMSDKTLRDQTGRNAGTAAVEEYFKNNPDAKNAKNAKTIEKKVFEQGQKDGLNHFDSIANGKEQIPAQEVFKDGKQQIGQQSYNGTRTFNYTNTKTNEIEDTHIATDGSVTHETRKNTISTPEQQEELVDGIYSKNDVDFLMSEQGGSKTKEQAIEILKTHPKYKDKVAQLEAEQQQQNANNANENSNSDDPDNPKGFNKDENGNLIDSEGKIVDKDGHRQKEDGTFETDEERDERLKEADKKKQEEEAKAKAQAEKDKRYLVANVINKTEKFDIVNNEDREKINTQKNAMSEKDKKINEFSRALIALNVDLFGNNLSLNIQEINNKLRSRQSEDAPKRYVVIPTKLLLTPENNDNNTGGEGEGEGADPGNNGIPPEDNSEGDKSEGDKSEGDKSEGDKSEGDKSEGDKSEGDNSEGDKNKEKEQDPTPTVNHIEPKDTDSDAMKQMKEKYKNKGTCINANEIPSSSSGLPYSQRALQFRDNDVTTVIKEFTNKEGKTTTTTTTIDINNNSWAITRTNDCDKRTSACSGFIQNNQCYPTKVSITDSDSNTQYYQVASNTSMLPINTQRLSDYVGDAEMSSIANRSNFQKVTPDNNNH